MKKLLTTAMLGLTLASASTTMAVAQTGTLGAFGSVQSATAGMLIQRGDLFIKAVDVTELQPGDKIHTMANGTGSISLPGVNGQSGCTLDVAPSSTYTVGNCNTTVQQQSVYTNQQLQSLEFTQTTQVAGYGAATAGASASGLAATIPLVVVAAAVIAGVASVSDDDDTKAVSP